MRTLVRVLTPIGFVLGIAVGVAAVLFSQQLEAVQKAADIKPQTMSAADLIKQGPGKNAHLELTDFRFGEPVVEKHNDEWQRVAIPVVPVKEKIDKPTHQVVLKVDVRDTAQLEDLRKQPTLRVFAATSLSSRSVLRQVAGNAPSKADGKKEPTKTIVLVAPRLALAETEILADDAFFAGSYTAAAWGVAGGGFALAFLCVWWAWSIQPPPSRLDPARQAQRDALATKPAMSTHQFPAWAYFMHSWQFYVVPIILFFGVFGVSQVFDLLADPIAAEKVSPAVIFMLMGLLGAWGLLAWAFRNRWSAPAEVAVYPDGLRWRVGGHWDAILWSDVKSVSRGETVVMRDGSPQGFSGRTALTLRDGRVLSFNPNRYSDYALLANSVQTAAGQAIAHDKEAELNVTGRVEFGPIAVGPDGVTLKGGILLSDQLIPWSNIKFFEVLNGHLVIHKNDYWFFASTSLPLADIPDYLPLLALLNNGGGRQPAPDPFKLGLPASSAS